MPKHLFFDFGAVLIPIDQSLTYKAFEKLGAQEALAQQGELFNQLERGELSSSDFLSAIQPYFFRKNIFKNDLAKAWNAMCFIEIPDEHLNLLKRLSKTFTLHLLSNTNAMHIEKIQELCGPFKYKQFISLFESVYFSHEMGSRKPEAAFFKKVLKEQDLKAEDCYFIDDREENVAAAEKLGIETWHFDPETNDLRDLKKRLK